MKFEAIGVNPATVEMVDVPVFVAVEVTVCVLVTNTVLVLIMVV